MPIKSGKRRWFWAVSALLLVIVLLSASGVFIFRNVLLPGQQQRIINILPFMENFLWRPPLDYALPTPLATSAISLEDLLAITLEPPATAAADQPVQPTLVP